LKFEIGWAKPSHFEFTVQWYYGKKKRMEKKKRCLEVWLLCIKRELNPWQVDLMNNYNMATTQVTTTPLMLHR
jgi:hypothetical protein